MTERRETVRGVLLAAAMGSTIAIVVIMAMEGNFPALVGWTVVLMMVVAEGNRTRWHGV